MATHLLDLPARQRLWSLPSLLRWNFKEEDVSAWAAQIHNWEQSEMEPHCSHSSLLCVWVCFFSLCFYCAGVYLMNWHYFFARSRWWRAEAGGFQYTRPLCSITAAAMVAYCWAKKTWLHSSAIHLSCKVHAEWKLWLRYIVMKITRHVYWQ